MRRFRRRRPPGGFTLIEVLLVLAILVILASLVTVNYISFQKRALVDQARAQIAVFDQALQAYHLSMNSYPTTDQGLWALREPPAGLASPHRWGPEAYLSKDVPLDPWDREYQYLNPGRMNPNSFDVWSLGPDGVDGTEDDIGNWD
jgi:general secretion pathway protein G